RDRQTSRGRRPLPCTTSFRSRNGAGKSTLVSTLTGLSATDTGHVEFAGEPAPPLSKQDDWKARVACVYQHAMVVPQLTVAENLRSEEHTSELQSLAYLVCRLL